MVELKNKIGLATAFGSYFLQIVDLIVFLKPWCVLIVGDGYY